VQALNIDVNGWPTGAVIDWLNLLNRMNNLPDRAKRLEEAQQVLRARLNFAGTRMVFSTEGDDYWWWLMASGDVNAAKLMLATLNLASWREDQGRMAQGLVSRMQKGAWSTTTGNVWGQLALDKFSAKFESVAVNGLTRATMANAQAGHDWSKRSDSGRFALTMPASQDANLVLNHDGAGKPWVTVQALAAQVLKAPVAAGYKVSKTVTAVERAKANAWTRGDVVRVKIEVDAQAPYTWVVVDDPVPAGATLLGGGLQRDSAVALQQQASPTGAWMAFEERSFAAYRAYYAYAPKGQWTMEYTMRLNQSGEFNLPPTRVEAMYAPEQFGATPNAKWVVVP
jgi:alpha-2-macroglobulin